MTSADGPKAKPAHVRLHVGYWGDERNCYKWDQFVAVDPKRSFDMRANERSPRFETEQSVWQAGEP
jgi:hypothetical protein